MLKDDLFAASGRRAQTHGVPSVRGVPQNSTRRRGVLAASWLGCAVIVVTSFAIPVRAQTPALAGTDARRPLDVATTFSLADVGWDDNVFRANKADGPVGDFTATFRPTAQLSLNRSRLKLASEGEVDFIYFRELADVRSIDANATSRVEAPWVG